jgi:uncharacterized protein
LQLPALYDVDVVHTRRAPLRNEFTYRASYWLVDFDQLPQPRGWVGMFVRVKRTDHPDIRRLLDDEGIPTARVVMLSGARTLGYAFNPITVFWCYDGSGEQCAVILEVHNTYGDGHAYVLKPDAEGEARVAKAMCVSPFNSVDGIYRVKLERPGSSVGISVILERPGEEPFVASLHGRRQPTTPRTVLRSVVRHSSVRNRMLIQWQGIRLWRRGLTVQPR